MAAGTLISVLSNIPWAQVVDNAPKVAEGAAKLWGSVKGLRRKGAEAPQASPPGAQAGSAAASGGDGAAGAAAAAAAAATPDALEAALKATATSLADMTVQVQSLQAHAQAVDARALLLEEQVLGLQDQLQASSELIKALADQNIQLVNGLDASRARLRRLEWLAGSAALLLAGAVAWLALRA